MLAREDEAQPIALLRSGYVELIDHDRLVELADRHDLVLKLLRRPGHFVLDGTLAVLVWPAGRVDDDLAEAIRESFVIHHRRTPEQDVEFCITQLVQIAARALSPALNDPFTAIVCIDLLSAGLARVLARPPRTPWWFDCHCARGSDEASAGGADRAAATPRIARMLASTQARSRAMATAPAHRPAAAQNAAP
jgi:hypothetical protein